MQEIVFLPFIYSLRIHPDPFLSTTEIVPVGSTRIASPRLITPSSGCRSNLRGRVGRRQGDKVATREVVMVTRSVGSGAAPFHLISERHARRAGRWPITP
jgi:hypothetical protein